MSGTELAPLVGYDLPSSNKPTVDVPLLGDVDREYLGWSFAALLLFCICLFVFGYRNDPKASSDEKVKKGLRYMGAAAGIILIICMIMSLFYVFTKSSGVSGYLMADGIGQMLMLLCTGLSQLLTAFK